MTLLAPLPTLTTRPLAWLRAQFRASEAWFIALAIGVGAGAGLLAVVQGRLAHGLQEHLYGITPDQRLSASTRIMGVDLLWLPLGGLLLAGFSYLVGLWKSRDEVARSWKRERTFTPRMPAAERGAHLTKWQKAVGLAG